MSVYTTLSIIKKDALDLIFRRLNHLTDRQIESILFELYAEKTLYNFGIVDDYRSDNWEYNYLDHKDEF